MSTTTQKKGGGAMKDAKEVKDLTTEIAELLSNASEKEKFLIKGILMGADLPETKEKDKEAV